MKKRLYIYGSVAIVLAGLASLLFLRGKEDKDSLETDIFETVDKERSGVHFANNITTSDSLNIFEFEYIYNGGGVGVGDFNNDGLPDLFFVGNMSPSKLYINKGDFVFQDVTGESGIENGGWPFGVSVVDINADGLQDIYLSMGGPGLRNIFPNKLFINNGNLKFTEQSKEYGLADSGQSIQTAFFDYDHDGDLDAYVLTGGGFERSPIVPHPILRDGSARNTDRLYRNDYDSALGHPVFTDVSKEANIVDEGFGLGISLLDINDDGWLDVYVTNDYLSNDHLYVNNRDGSFTERLLEYFSHTSHFAMGNDAGDINNDGLPDIVAVDMLPDDHYDRSLMLGPNQHDKFYYSIKQGYAPQYMRNTLQLNLGNGRFSEIGQMAGIYKTSWSWAVLFADLDNDEFQDIFITNGFGKNVTDLDFVKYRSNLRTGTSDPKQQVRILSDSLSGRPPIKTHSYAFRNQGGYSFKDMSAAWGFRANRFSNGAAYVDLDNDGDLDLVTNNIDEAASLYRNKTNEKGVARSNYLQLKLSGPAGNTSAIGARIDIRYGGKLQTRLQAPVRGFESTVHDIIHFGLGEHTLIDTVEIYWPGAERTVLTQVKANQMLHVDYHKQERTPLPPLPEKQKTFFRELSASALGIDYFNKPNEFNDFNFERLVPKKYSQNGQGISVGDVNGDGLDDFYVSGAYQQAGSLYIQHQNGTFSPKVINKWNQGCEESGSLLFDSDGDGDLDLYIVSGGNEFSEGHARYQDQLYRNDGKGNFMRDSSALPAIRSSGSCVIAADYDGDGDEDLFVGGRIVPGGYPETPESYLLRNDGGRFTDVTDTDAPGLRKAGMITSALWSDVNNDHLPDLILAGEWMPITVFRNTSTKLEKSANQPELGNTEGWWQSLVAGDFDNDGDIDYVAGNWGTNNPYEVSSQHPMTVAYKDFDGNGSTDAILSCYQGDESYPVASLDYLLEQLPVMRKKILTYAQYAACNTENLLSLLGDKDIRKLECRTLQSVFLRNDGKGNFTLSPLPIEAQVAPLFGMIAEDVNDDGWLDLVAVGNFYANDVVVGKYDALKGLTMTGNGKGQFIPQPPGKTGFSFEGDARAFTRVESRNGSLLLISKNADSVGVFLAGNSKRKRIFAERGDQFAMIGFRDGSKRKVEMQFGSTYLSQSSRSIIVPSDAVGVEFFGPQGQRSRESVVSIPVSKMRAE